MTLLEKLLLTFLVLHTVEFWLSHLIAWLKNRKQVEISEACAESWKNQADYWREALVSEKLRRQLANLKSYKPKPKQSLDVTDVPLSDQDSSTI